MARVWVYVMHSNIVWVWLMQWIDTIVELTMWKVDFWKKPRSIFQFHWTPVKFRRREMTFSLCVDRLLHSKECPLKIRFQFFSVWILSSTQLAYSWKSMQHFFLSWNLMLLFYCRLLCCDQIFICLAAQKNVTVIADLYNVTSVWQFDLILFARTAHRDTLMRFWSWDWSKEGLSFSPTKTTYKNETNKNNRKILMQKEWIWQEGKKSYRIQTTETKYSRQKNCKYISRQLHRCRHKEKGNEEENCSTRMNEQRKKNIFIQKEK